MPALPRLLRLLAEVRSGVCALLPLPNSQGPAAAAALGSFPCHPPARLPCRQAPHHTSPLWQWPAGLSSPQGTLRSASAACTRPQSHSRRRYARERPPRNNPPSLPCPSSLTAYFAQREKQLVFQSAVAAARGSSAWRTSACSSSSELLHRRGRRPLLVRVPRRMTGVDEADSRVLYICCVAVQCSTPEPAWPLGCAAATAAAEQGPDSAAAVERLQRAASAPPGASPYMVAGAAEQAALERLGTPPVTAEQLPAAKRSRRQVAVGLPAAGTPASGGQSLEQLLDYCTSSPCLAPGSSDSHALLVPPSDGQPSLVAGPAVLPQLAAGRGTTTGSPLDRLLARVRSLLSPQPDACPCSAS